MFKVGENSFFMLSLLESDKFIVQVMKTAIDNFSGQVVTFEKDNGLVVVTFPPAARGFKKVVVRLSKQQFTQQFKLLDEEINSQGN